MTSTPVEERQEEGLEQGTAAEKAVPVEKAAPVRGGRAARAARAVRGATLAAPLLLFGAASLIGLGFWITQLPLLAWVALGCAVAGGFLSLIVAFMMKG